MPETIAKTVGQPRIKLSKLGEDDRLLLIYQTAAKVIHAKGYDATSLNDIADAVGITKGGLYHYIDGKQSLLFKIMSYAMDMLQAEVVTTTATLTDAERTALQPILDKLPQGRGRGGPGGRGGRVGPPGQ